MLPPCIPRTVRAYDLFLNLILEVTNDIPWRQIFTYNKPSACPTRGWIITIYSPTAYTLCILPDQLGEVSSRHAETGRSIKVINLALLAPGLDHGGDVCIAYGKVFTAWPALIEIREWYEPMNIAPAWAKTYRVLPETFVRITTSVSSERIIPLESGCIVLIAVEIGGV